MSFPAEAVKPAGISRRFGVVVLWAIWFSGALAGAAVASLVWGLAS